MFTREASPAAPIVLGDWGTSRLRLFLSVEGRTIGRIEGPGIGSRDASAAETLRISIAPWVAKYKPQCIIMCGMAGSHEGLVETPYAPCPIGALRWAYAALECTGGPLPIIMAPGLSCEHNDGTHDVMRGEETQIFGALSLPGGFDCANRLIVLPGTHAKWVRLVDGRIVGFHTYITGEVFALLRDHSSLARPSGNETISNDGFLSGLERAADKAPLGSLFEVRTAQLRAGRSRRWALGFLSGLLIGHEVKEALATVGQPEQLSLIGDPFLTDRYRVALARHQISSVSIDGDTCVIAGLRVLANMIAVIPQC